MGLETLLIEYGIPPSEVGVLLADDADVRALNHRFRGLDEATDVLTFPAIPLPGAPLGDIAIGIGFAARQAEDRGVSLDDEIAFLAIHGGLHLLGYDDRTETERADMVRRMNEIAAKVGLETHAAWCSMPHDIEERAATDGG